jgi:hypothetical protein
MWKWLKIKVWWQDATHFLFIFHIFITYIRTFNHSYNTFIRRHSLGPPSPHRLKAQWEDPPCGAESRTELGPALQQAGALPTEPRRTIKIYIRIIKNI